MENCKIVPRFVEIFIDDLSATKLIASSTQKVSNKHVYTKDAVGMCCHSVYYMYLLFSSSCYFCLLMTNEITYMYLQMGCVWTKFSMYVFARMTTFVVQLLLNTF